MDALAPGTLRLALRMLSDTLKLYNPTLVYTGLFVSVGLLLAGSTRGEMGDLEGYDWSKINKNAYYVE